MPKEVTKKIEMINLVSSRTSQVSVEVENKNNLPSPTTQDDAVSVVIEDVRDPPITKKIYWARGMLNMSFIQEKAP